MISRFNLPALARIGLAAALLAPLTMPSHAEVLTIAGTGADLEAIRVLADAFEGANANVKVDVLPSLGSSGGVKAVFAGVINLGLTSRPRACDSPSVRFPVLRATQASAASSSSGRKGFARVVTSSPFASPSIFAISR